MKIKFHLLAYSWYNILTGIPIIPLLECLKIKSLYCSLCCMEKCIPLSKRKELCEWNESSFKKIYPVWKLFRDA